MYRGPFLKTQVTGLTPGVPYSITVSAVNYNGEGTLTSATTLMSCVAPSGVPNLIEAATTPTSVTLRWSQPSDDGGCDVSGYQIYRDDGAEGAITTAVAFNAADVAGSGATPDYTAEPYVFEHTVALDSSLTGLSVRFMLEAVNSEGSTLSSSYLTALVAGTPVAPPTGPTRTSSSRTALTVALP